MSLNVFLTKWSEISGDRIDPLMVLYKKTTQSFKYETVAFEDLLLSNPMYGANEAGVKRTDENEPRYIRITDIDEFGNLKDGLGVTAQVIEDKYFLNENDLLFARSGATVGKAYIHRKKDYECFFAGYMIRFIVDNNKINPYYVFLYTQLDIYKKWVSSIQRAAGQPNINAEEYKSLPIPIPPKEIQEEIVNKIQSAYKQKQQKEDKAKKLLDSIDDYLLKELGIDLPKIDETNISKRVFLRKWSEISGDRFDSEYYKTSFELLGKSIISEKTQRLGEIISYLMSGATPKSGGDDYLENGEHYFLRLVNFSDDMSVDLTDSYFITEDIYNGMLKRVQLEYGDILFGIAGSVGKMAIYEHNQKAVVNQAIAVIRLKNNVNPKYIAYYLNSIIIKKQIARLQRPVAQPNLNTEELKSLKIVLPEIEQQNKIANYIENIRQQAKSLKQQSIDDFEKAKKEVEAMLLGETDEF